MLTSGSDDKRKNRNDDLSIDIKVKNDKDDAHQRSVLLQEKALHLVSNG
jgi:hypothetical protein